MQCALGAFKVGCMTSIDFLKATSDNWAMLNYTYIFLDKP